MPSLVFGAMCPRNISRYLKIHFVVCATRLLGSCFIFIWLSPHVSILEFNGENNEIAPRHPVGLGFTPTGRTVSEFIQSEHVTVGATPFWFASLISQHSKEKSNSKPWSLPDVSWFQFCFEIFFHFLDIHKNFVSSQFRRSIHPVPQSSCCINQMPRIIFKNSCSSKKPQHVQMVLGLKHTIISYIISVCTWMIQLNMICSWWILD